MCTSVHVTCQCCLADVVSLHGNHHYFITLPLPFQQSLLPHLNYVIAINIITIILLLTYLCAWHGLWVHDVVFDGAPRAIESRLQQSPDGGLSRARGAHHYHAHPLSQLSVQLQCLVDLMRNMSTN